MYCGIYYYSLTQQSGKLLFSGYTSTRKPGFLDIFIDTAIIGKAQDDGLFVGNLTPTRMTHGQLKRLVNDSYSDVATKILEPWLSPIDVPRQVQV